MKEMTNEELRRLLHKNEHPLWLRILAKVFAITMQLAILLVIIAIIKWAWITVF